jgi:hypothetical protein
MGVPPNHPFINRLSIINHPAIGVPPLMETPILVFVASSKDERFFGGDPNSPSSAARRRNFLSLGW